MPAGMKVMPIKVPKPKMPKPPITSKNMIAKPKVPKPAVIGKRQWTDEGILRRQKKAQAGLSIGSGALGLATLATIKKPNISTKLGATSLGTGGASSFNFASIQNKESKKRGPKQNVYVVRSKKDINEIKSGKQKPVGKRFTMDFGLDSVYQGEHLDVIAKREEVEKGWSEDHPKGRVQAFTVNRPLKDGGSKQMGVTDLTTHYKGKSLILRRPKYQVVGSPDRNLRHKKGDAIMLGPNQKMNPNAARQIHSAYKGGKKQVDMGGVRYKHHVSKAYNPEEKRMRRADAAATGLGVGSGAAAVGAGIYGKKALGRKHITQTVHPAKPDTQTKANPVKGGQTPSTKVSSAKPRTKVVQSGTMLRSGPKNLPGFKQGLKAAGKAGGLGVTAVGLAVASDRVRRYKSGSGASYRPLHRTS